VYEVVKIEPCLYLNCERIYRNMSRMLYNVSTGFNETLNNTTITRNSTSETNDILIGLGVSGVLLIMIVVMIVGCRNQICTPI
jgi:hypothetical protein